MATQATNMQRQEQAFEADTRSLNQRIAAVEEEVKKDIKEMDRVPGS